jgi:hypothetical protein
MNACCTSGTCRLNLTLAVFKREVNKRTNYWFNSLESTCSIVEENSIKLSLKCRFVMKLALSSSEHLFKTKA